MRAKHSRAKVVAVYDAPPDWLIEALLELGDFDVEQEDASVHTLGFI